MINTAIVEDENTEAEKLRSFFEQYHNDKGVDFHIVHFQSGEEFLKNYRRNFDLVLMDIEMSGINGMETAQKLRKTDPEVVLVFVTNMAQYAVKGYEVDALDFIVKPVTYSDFTFKIKRVLNNIALKNESYFTIPITTGLKRVKLSELTYVEIAGHNLIYHLADETITIRGSLKQVEESLRDAHFLKCNNCYLVNPRHIKEVKGFTVTVGGDELAISRPRKKAFLQELNEYLMGGGQ